MNAETMTCFLVGLRIAIKKTGLTQKEFSEGVTSGENLSKILNSKVGTTVEMRKNLARRANMEVSEMVSLGKKPEDTEPSLPPISTEAFDPLDMLSSVALAYRKEKSSAEYWQSCFECLSSAACIIDQDKTIAYQNQASRSLYKKDMVGEKMCSACMANDAIPHPCGNCAIEQAMIVGEPAQHFITINDQYLKVMASPTQTSKGRHVIVVAFLSPEFELCQRERDILEEQMLFLLRTAKTPLIFGDQNQNISYVSKEFLELFQIEREEVGTTTHYWALLAEKLVNPGVAIITSKKARHDKLQGECSIELLTGEKGILLAEPAVSKDGGLVGVLIKIWID